MATITDLANELGKLYKEEAKLSFGRWKISQDIERRRIHLTPADYSSLGKSEDARKVALAKIFAGNEVLANLERDLADDEFDLAATNAEIKSLEAERRAAEWEIRSALVETLNEARIQKNRRGDRAEAAFDDVTDSEMDKVAFEGDAGEMVFACTDIPF